MALAAAEGLELVTAANATGYKGIFLNQAGKYEARIREGGKQVHLGTFGTAEEAALAYARHAGPQRVAEEAAAARCEGPKPLTAAEALAAAAPPQTTSGRRKCGIMVLCFLVLWVLVLLVWDYGAVILVL